MQLMKDLNQLIDYAVPLYCDNYCDNQSAIHLVENSVFYARTKHMEVHYHFLRESLIRRNRDMSIQD